MLYNNYCVVSSPAKLYHLFPTVGPKGDCRSAQVFMRNMFMEGIPSGKNGQFYPHFTCATNTENIKKIFEDVRATIVAEHVAITGSVWLVTLWHNWTLCILFH